jgi:signal transduction histidine kinase
MGDLSLIIPDGLLMLAVGAMSYKLTRGIPFANTNNSGYRLVVIGTVLVFLTSIFDFVDDFTWVQSQLVWMRPSVTDPYVVIVGIVPGVIFIAFGLAKWLPSLFQLDREIERRKLIERELRVEKERAQAANIAKSEFLANMSHEIRTPMNGVLGMIEIALNADVSDKVQSYLTVGAKSGQTLMTIINDILDLSRLEAGQISIEMSSSLLPDLTQEVIDMFQLEISKKDIHVRLAIESDLRNPILIDTVRYRQIMFNLVGNAIKFSTTSDIEINCSVEQSVDGQLTLVSSIVDQGVGIPAEALPHLFDRFTQADNTVTRLHGGTGLGLAICKQLSNFMGGTIEVKSIVGAGSTFVVKLPIAWCMEARDDLAS